MTRAEAASVPRRHISVATLIVRGKIFGTMPLTAKLQPGELRKGLRLMSWRTLWFAFTLPFRRG